MVEMQQLHAALADANARLLQSQADSQSGAVTQDQTDALALMLQELRQPVSAILTQAETLRQSLHEDDQSPVERITAAAERLRALLDEMAGVLTGSQRLTSPIAADLGLLIDNAIANTRVQMREKNIALRVDLPEALPQLNADADALQQVIICLLHNAGAVTPLDGVIRLRVRVQDGAASNDFLLLQVTDSGGGVSTRDLPRLFSLSGLDAEAQIEGIGSAYELGMARNLVEAMNGRMMIDAEEGKSTTVSVLLPVAPQVDDLLLPEE
jgi:signal transduction histidine kinase